MRDLVITLEQKLEAAAGLDEKKASLLEIARLYDATLDDVDEAVGALRRLLELDGADPAALEGLSALYRREHRWGDLAGVLARARDLAADEAARIGWQLQIAALYESEIGDDEAAVEGYRTVLGLDDRNVQALAGLERLYTKLDRFAELNRVYERQIALSDDPHEQVRVWPRSAAIHEEKLHDPRSAIEKNEAILGLDGGNAGAMKALERLYRPQGQWDRLIIVHAAPPLAGAGPARAGGAAGGHRRGLVEGDVPGRSRRGDLQPGAPARPRLPPGGLGAGPALRAERQLEPGARHAAAARPASPAAPRTRSSSTSASAPSTRTCSSTWRPPRRPTARALPARPGPPAAPSGP